MKECKNITIHKNKPFWSQKDGATAIEFAIIAPVFFMLLMGIIEIGLIMFAQTVLSGSLAHGARIGKTGYTEGERAAYIRSEILRLSGGVLDPGQLQVNPLHYESFESVGAIEPCIPANIDPCLGSTPNVHFQDINGNGIRDDRGIAGPGGRNRIVLYEARYDWPIFTPMMGHFFGNGSGTFELSATALVKNEGF